VDQREDGVMGPGSGEERAQQKVDRLEKKVGVVRDNLDGLVSELGNRRGVLSRRYFKRAAFALAVGGAAAGAAVSIIARRLASAALPPARSADQAVGT
jgi:hypothetical protein